MLCPYPYTEVVLAKPKLPHCQRSLGILFSAHQLIGCTLNHIVLTLEACWMPYERVHGSVGGELQNSMERGA